MQFYKWSVRGGSDTRDVSSRRFPSSWSSPPVCVYRSADFQSAVSPICNRQSVGSVPRAVVPRRLAECNSAIQQTTSLRYERRQRGKQIRTAALRTLNSYTCVQTRHRNGCLNELSLRASWKRV